MSEPLILTNNFVEHTEAKEHHKAGLEAELSGDLDTAHEEFGLSLAVLRNLEPSVDVSVQVARVLRDHGFTFIRQAIKDDVPEHLERAAVLIGESEGLTVADIWASGPAPGGSPGKRIMSIWEQKELFSEFGATISVGERLKTVRRWVFGLDIDQEGSRYEQAHHFLTRGSNGYFRVSNAMVAARVERLDGNIDFMGKWVARAAVGLGYTALLNRGNLRRAAETTVSRSRDLVLQSAAIKSVKTRP